MSSSGWTRLSNTHRITLSCIRPVQDGPVVHYHWHIEIMPKLTKVAGFEWGSGFYLNPTPPEDAAKFLRELSL